MRRTAFRSSPQRSAWVCVGLLLLCVLLIWPFLESGMTDDWSTVRTAQLLAQTGHIHYNGWEAAILGWPLYVAAVFIKLFGPSFTSIRASDLLESIATVVLLHRTYLRAGLTRANATFGTLLLALTPMYLLASVIFMTDIPGLFAVLVCFYACLRALQAEAGRSAAAWIAFAAISNAVLGTSRQIAWLGVLLMVPGAVWLLRRKRLVVLAGALSVALSAVFIVACMWWFKQQPYTLAAPLRPHEFTPAVRIAALTALIRIPLDLTLFLLPAAFAFLPAFRRAGRRAFIFAVVALVVLLCGTFWVHHLGQIDKWLSPTLLFWPVHPQSAENTFTMTQMPVKGPPPLRFTTGFRIGLTVAVALGVALFAGALALASPLKRRTRPERRQSQTPPLSWHELALLTVPFLLGNVAFLVSRGSYEFIYDRYFLPLLIFLILGILRFFQERAGTPVPFFSKVLLFLMAAYSVLTLHDNFAVYRASLAACNEVLAAGYPRPAVDGGWEYNHFTQILVGGYVHQPGVKMPNKTRLGNADTNTRTVCSLEVREWTPDVHPLFAVAYPSSPCPRVPGFRPVTFRTWLPPFQRTADVVREILPGDPLKLPKQQD